MDGAPQTTFQSLGPIFPSQTACARGGVHFSFLSSSGEVTDGKAREVLFPEEVPFHVLDETFPFGPAPLAVPIVRFYYCEVSEWDYYIARVSPSYVVYPDTSRRAPGCVYYFCGPT